MDKPIKQTHPTERAVKTPTAECLECKLYRAFVTCFGLTFADVKRM